MKHNQAGNYDSKGLLVKSVKMHNLYHSGYASNSVIYKSWDLPWFLAFL